MAETVRRTSMLPIIMLLMSMQLMLLSNHGGYSESTHHSVMLEKFPPCSPTWKPGRWSNLSEEIYRCDGDSEDRGSVYHDLNGQWTAYGWGLKDGEFQTVIEAKKHIESESAYWMRPKAPWWKFWKEFK